MTDPHNYEAGRELDAEIAAKVMGLEVSSDRNAATRAYLYLASRAPRYMEDVPPYSTDIAAAWEVVQYFEAKGMTVCLFGHPESAQKWDCDISGDIEGRLVTTEATESSGDTAPHAICLAALKTVE